MSLPKPNEKVLTAKTLRDAWDNMRKGPERRYEEETEPRPDKMERILREISSLDYEDRRYIRDRIDTGPAGDERIAQVASLQKYGMISNQTVAKELYAFEPIPYASMNKIPYTDVSATFSAYLAASAGFMDLPIVRTKDIDGTFIIEKEDLNKNGVPVELPQNPIILEDPIIQVKRIK